MKIHRREFLRMTAGICLAAGCSSREQYTRPPQIRYGRDVCDECGMIISDQRFAAAASGPDSNRFDDVGCFVNYRRKRSPAWNSQWVADYSSGDWVRAENAWYVLSPEIKSPMGWGIAAFRNDSDARNSSAQVNGEVVDWEALQSRPLRQNIPDPGAGPSSPARPLLSR